MLVWLVVRSLSTPTVDGVLTVEVLSPERTSQRSTVPLHTPLAGLVRNPSFFCSSRRISNCILYLKPNHLLLPVLPAVAWSSFLMLLVLLSHCLSTLILTVLERRLMTNSLRSSARTGTCVQVLLVCIKFWLLLIDLYLPMPFSTWAQPPEATILEDRFLRSLW